MEELNGTGKGIMGVGGKAAVKPIAVVGDGMMDYWHVGAAEHLSFEAPVPVVKVQNTIATPGGAGNVADNLRKLGDEVIGIYGANHPQKHRLLVGDQQIARWDINDCCTGIYTIELEDVLQKCQAVIVADYAKGSITAETVKLIGKSGLPVFVDTRRSPVEWYGIATAVFPNEKEFNEFEAEYVKFNLLVRKRGALGMELYSRGRLWMTVPAMATHVRSVAGAGDTVIAAWVSEYMRQGAMESVANRATRFAAAAAAIAVEAPYTTAVARAAVEARLGGRNAS